MVVFIVSYKCVLDTVCNYSILRATTYSSLYVSTYLAKKVESDSESNLDVKFETILVYYFSFQEILSAGPGRALVLV